MPNDATEWGVGWGRVVSIVAGGILGAAATVTLDNTIATDPDKAYRMQLRTTAGTLVIGGVTVSCGASSITVDGTAGQQLTLFLYYDDPQFQGGTLPLGMNTNIVDSANVDGRVAITTVQLTFPVAGGSSTGGGGGSGGTR